MSLAGAFAHIRATLELALEAGGWQRGVQVELRTLGIGQLLGRDWFKAGKAKDGESTTP